MIRNAFTVGSLVLCTLIVCACSTSTARAGGYYYAPPSYYVAPPVVYSYYPPAYAPVVPVAPAPVVVTPAPVVYQPAFVVPEPVVYGPVLPTRTSYKVGHFGRRKVEYEIRTPYGEHEYKYRYNPWTGRYRVKYDFDD